MGSAAAGPRRRAEVGTLQLGSSQRSRRTLQVFWGLGFGVLVALDAPVLRSFHSLGRPRQGLGFTSDSDSAHH